VGPAVAPEGEALLIRGCDALVAPGDLRHDVDIAICGPTIASLRAAGDAAPEPAAAVIDGRGLLAIPGLVNAHTHSPENCLRGSGEGLPLEVWLTRMFGTAGSFDPEDHYVTALAGAVEMLLSGATSVLDHLWMTPPTAEATDAVLRAYRDVGIRAAVAPLVADMDATGALADALDFDIRGALFTDLAPAAPAAELQAQLEDAMARWHGAARGRLQVFAGPCGAQWCSDELLTGLAEATRRHGSSLTLHLLETRLQSEVCRLRFGVGAVEALDRLGILGTWCSLAHGVWLDPADAELIAARGAVVVHNPSANLRLGSGVAPVPELLAAGARVALGADGCSSSDNQVLWSQLKLAALVHNDDVRERWVSSADALAMATTGGAAALGLAGRLGRLEPGYLADVVLVDRRGTGLAGAQDVVGALALSETGQGVVHVIVDGRLVVAFGRCLTVDEQGVREALHEQARNRAAAQAEVPAATAQAMRRMDGLKRLVHAGRRAAAENVP
jgi:5-methylthioadenosine/S-adenosylhomocysteine deaminase